jgi:hypothetical protein
MARWILGYTMFVLGIFWVGWDIVGPGPLLWGLGATCFFCSLVGGFMWWQDERRWQQEMEPSASSTKDSDVHGWPMAHSTRSR